MHPLPVSHVCAGAPSARLSRVGWCAFCPSVTCGLMRLLPFRRVEPKPKQGVTKNDLAPGGQLYEEARVTLPDGKNSSIPSEGNIFRFGARTIDAEFLSLWFGVQHSAEHRRHAMRGRRFLFPTGLQSLNLTF